VTIQVDLAPEDEARLLAGAREQGIEPAEYVRLLLTQHLSSLSAGAEATRELLRSWREEDETSDPELLRQAVEELTSFKEAMNEPRVAAGARCLYP